MNDLHVNTKLTACIGDDKDTDGATASLEGFGQAVPKVGLINDRDSLLDITSLGHGNNSSILQIKNSVLLEDRAEHGLDDDRRAWIGDERGLLMQLLGEEINAQVSVLTSGSRGGDADDLARTALKDQEITNTDVVAGDGDSVGGVGRFSRGAGRLGGTGRSTGTIFIVVTHLVGGRGDAGSWSCGLFGDTCLLEEDFRGTRRVDGLLSERNFLSLLSLEARRWVNGGTGDTNLLGIGWLLEAGRGVDGGLVYTDVLTEG